VLHMTTAEAFVNMKPILCENAYVNVTHDNCFVSCEFFYVNVT
jgi:hypothetical protein